MHDEAVHLLQQVGLTQYEAEAYYTLLHEGALTGYELGKRSSVPLPRSYDVLQRLTQRGLALVQPGEPPRYRAADPAQFLDQRRASMSATLDEAGRLLSALPGDDAGEEFWVVRTRPHILTRVAAMVRTAERSIHLVTSEPRSPGVEDLFALARANDRCALFLHKHPSAPPGQLAVVVDDREALLGSISPADRCQAVTSAHPALVAAALAYAGRDRVAGSIPPAPPPEPSEIQRQDWLRWEMEKQRRLLRRGRGAA